MAMITRLRAQHSFVLKARNVVSRVLAKMLKKRPKGLHVSRLNAHMARDIGLSEAERARLTMTYPSQTHHHPRG